MFRRLRYLGSVGLVLFVCSGCAREARVLDVHDHPAWLRSGERASHEATHRAILRALGERGYVVDRDDGQTIVARVSRGTIWASMRIGIGEGRYSISHADSCPEFMYDE